MKTILGEVDIVGIAFSTTGDFWHFFNYAESGLGPVTCHWLRGCALDTPKDNFNARPRQAITVPVDYTAYVGKYPVTNYQYGLYMSANPGVRQPDYWLNTNFNAALQPVVGITWDEAKAFATWVGGRLLTEAEFERVSHNQLFYCDTHPYSALYPIVVYGAGAINSSAWFVGNAEGKTHPVGLKNAINSRTWYKYPGGYTLQGISCYDQIGNVWQWVEDDYHDNHTGGPVDGSAWVDAPRSLYRVVKGGSFKCEEGLVRPWSRLKVLATGKANDIGFRIVANLGSF